MTYHNPNDTRSGECLKNYFEDILLIIIYHFPFYESIPLLKSFYQDAFKNIVICGSETYSHHHVMVVDIHQGHYGYECVGEAIRRYGGSKVIYKHTQQNKKVRKLDTDFKNSLIIHKPCGKSCQP